MLTSSGFFIHCYEVTDWHEGILLAWNMPRWKPSFQHFLDLYLSLSISFSTSGSLSHCGGFSDTCRDLDLNDKHVQHELERQRRGCLRHHCLSEPNASPSLSPFLFFSTSHYLGSLYLMIHSLWYGPIPSLCCLTTENNGDERTKDAPGRGWLVLLTTCPLSASAAHSVASAEPLLRNHPQRASARMKRTHTYTHSHAHSFLFSLPPVILLSSADLLRFWALSLQQLQCKLNIYAACFWLAVRDMFCTHDSVRCMSLSSSLRRSFIITHKNNSIFVLSQQSAWIKWTSQHNMLYDYI